MTDFLLDFKIMEPEILTLSAADSSLFGRTTPFSLKKGVEVSLRVSFEKCSLSELKILTHHTYSTISRLNLFFSFIPAALTITLIA
jgi:hypothetical protein